MTKYMMSTQPSSVMTWGGCKGQVISGPPRVASSLL